MNEHLKSSCIFRQLTVKQPTRFCNRDRVRQVQSYVQLCKPQNFVDAHKISYRSHILKNKPSLSCSLRPHKRSCSDGAQFKTDLIWIWWYGGHAQREGYWSKASEHAATAATQLCTLTMMTMVFFTVVRSYCRGFQYELPVRFGSPACTTVLNQLKQTTQPISRCHCLLFWSSGAQPMTFHMRNSWEAQAN